MRIAKTKRRKVNLKSIVGTGIISSVAMNLLNPRKEIPNAKLNVGFEGNEVMARMPNIAFLRKSVNVNKSEMVQPKSFEEGSVIRTKKGLVENKPVYYLGEPL